MTEPTGLPWYYNSHILQIQSIPGMGWCLFTTGHFRNEEDIAVYAGTNLTEAEARSEKLKSAYVVELGICL
jgi:formylmethanofuran dehydrogenase subunit B